MNHASLFSGIGAAEIAAAMLGWENIFQCEIDKFCQTVLNYWFPNSICYGNIFNTDFKQWQGKIDVLSGGFPCQPFSNAGQRKGTKDNRYLWPQMLRAVQEIKPTWIVAENVVGILTMVESDCKTTMESQADLFNQDNHNYTINRQQFIIHTIIKNLEDIGYSVQPFIIPACSVGAPHRRNRIFIIAFNRDSNGMGLQDNEILEHIKMYGKFGSTSNDRQVKLSVTNSPNTRFQKMRRRKNRLRKSCTTSDTKGIRGQKRFHCGTSYELGERWRNFPTVSPILGRIDGIPFDVDNLTIPFNRWRNQSLKAYGNAIVPQVLYEIFRSIEIVMSKIDKK